MMPDSGRGKPRVLATCLPFRCMHHNCYFTKGFCVFSAPSVGLSLGWQEFWFWQKSGAIYVLIDSVA